MDSRDTLDFINSYMIGQQVTDTSSTHLNGQPDSVNDNLTIKRSSNPNYLASNTHMYSSSTLSPSDTNSASSANAVNVHSNFMNDLSDFSVEFSDQQSGLRQLPVTQRSSHSSSSESNSSPHISNSQQHADHQNHSSNSTFEAGASNGIDDYLTLFEMPSSNSVSQSSVSHSNTTDNSTHSNNQHLTQTSPHLVKGSYNDVSMNWNPETASNSNNVTKSHTIPTQPVASYMKNPNPDSYTQPHTDQHTFSLDKNPSSLASTVAESSLINSGSGSNSDKAYEFAQSSELTTQFLTELASSATSDTVFTQEPDHHQFISGIESSQQSNIGSAEKNQYSAHNMGSVSSRPDEFNSDSTSNIYQPLDSPQTFASNYHNVLENNNYLSSQNAASENRSSNTAIRINHSTQKSMPQTSTTYSRNVAKRQKTDSIHGNNMYEGLWESSVQILENKSPSDRARVTVRAIVLAHAKSSSTELINRFIRYISQSDVVSPNIPDPDEFSIAFEVVYEEAPETFWTGLRTKTEVLTRIKLWLTRMLNYKKFEGMIPLLKALTKMSLTKEILENYQFSNVIQAASSQGSPQVSFYCAQILKRADELASIYALAGTKSGNVYQKLPTIPQPTPYPYIKNSGTNKSVSPPNNQTTSTRRSTVATINNSVPSIEKANSKTKKPSPAVLTDAKSTISQRKVASRTPVTSSPLENSAKQNSSTLATSSSSFNLKTASAPASKAPLPYIEPITSSSRKKAKAEAAAAAAAAATSKSGSPSATSVSSRVVKKTATKSIADRTSKPLGSFTIPRRTVNAKSTSTTTSPSSLTTSSVSPTSSTATSFFKTLKKVQRPTAPPAPSTASLLSQVKNESKLSQSKPVAASPAFSFSSHLKSLRQGNKKSEKEVITIDGASGTDSKKRKKKTVKWRSEMELVQVKEYELDPEERASKRSGIGKDFDAKFLDFNEGKNAFSFARSHGTFITDDQEFDQTIPWYPPQKIVMPESMYDKLDDLPSSRGGKLLINSIEAEERRKKEESRLMAVYMTDSDIPDTPSEVEVLKETADPNHETVTVPLANQLLSDPDYLNAKNGITNSNNGNMHNTNNNMDSMPMMGLPFSMPPPIGMNSNTNFSNSAPPVAQGNPDMAAISSLLSGLKQTMTPAPQVEHPNDNEYNPLQPNAAALLSQIFNNGNNMGQGMNYGFNMNNDNDNNNFNNGNSVMNSNKLNKKNIRPTKGLSPKTLELRSRDVRPFVRNDKTTLDKWKFPCHFFREKCGNGDSCPYLHILEN